MQISIEFVMIEVSKGVTFSAAAKQLVFAALEFGHARMVFNDQTYEVTENELVRVIESTHKKPKKENREVDSEPPYA